MRENNIRHHIPARKPRLTDEHRRKRLEFAEMYLERDSEFWSTVVFSDETMFSTEGQAARHCYRPKGQRYNEIYIQTNEHHRRINRGMWGWISSFGPGELTQIEGRSTGEQYLEILEQILIPSVRAYLVPPGEPFHFVQDNAPTHTSRIVKEWFQDHEDIILIKLPPNSPDLNPIENVWAEMKKDQQGPLRRNERSLIEHYTDRWEQIKTGDLCKMVIGSMNSRLQQVIDANGGHIPY